MSNPYSNLPNHQFWRRAVADIEPFLLDPAGKPKIRIAHHQRVATAGSCFAQHIARRLAAEGFNYFVTEAGEHLDPAIRVEHGYGVFSARFGNIYTTRQLLQLFEESFGYREPIRTAWRDEAGRWVDAMRPQVEPGGYINEERVYEERAVHLAAVRRMFLECDVFIFTLGLTEAWRSRRDGTVFPVAPGVTAGDYDPALHEFVNFRVAEVISDLTEFLERFKSVNEKVRVVLTVSPVPLIATYEPRHVLVSNTASKAILRVAADEVCSCLEWVDYFPSYEIITGNFNDSSYYDRDYRSVNAMGVDHAMRCFLSHYTETPPKASSRAPIYFEQLDDVICDEEAIDRIRG